MLRFCLGVCVVSLMLTLCATVNAQENSTGKVVYLESLLSEKTSQQIGYERYRSYPAVMSGVTYEHSLMTGVQNHPAPNQRYSWLTISLDGKYERFQAMVGREDREHAMGPAYCFFEVYGDGARLFHSEAIRSELSPVGVDTIAFAKRKVPQDIDISVKGVRTLRLLTRFATEFSQQARYVHRALGCVWGDARLTPAKSDDQSEWDNIAQRAAILLTKDLILAPSADSTPYHIAITPLKLDPAALRTNLLPPTAEPGLRSNILKQICAIKHGNGTMFAEVDADDAKAIADALPVNSPLRTKSDVVCAIARGADADYLIFGKIEPNTTNWQLFLRLFDTKTGRALREITTPIVLGATSETPSPLSHPTD